MPSAQVAGPVAGAAGRAAAIGRSRIPDNRGLCILNRDLAVPTIAFRARFFDRAQRFEIRREARGN
ncbi:hypothetical protein OO17_15260 [Rhodopseudomonas palustris]|uniref:Uncharacterized protein n=1 Tax=Rhodopseudomonas palustris TaxID=1076 RepID=A0A0D7EPI7_RHOPL|nr:hypothetical protein OO17_15260 [Rhodopseudomonas palustris]